MRVLLLMRGSAGCGKSTFIDENGLRPYAISADEIRQMYESPVLNIDGITYSISQNNDKLVWGTLFSILESRMSRGEFTVIDATNSKASEMTRYKKLASQYRYRIYCVDMTDIPIEVVKERNKNRTNKIKVVPDEVIDKFYSRFSSQSVPSGIKVIKPEEIDSVRYKATVIDPNVYKRIHVFGDVHGCFTVLKSYIDQNGGVKDDELYIFSGDYVDRGIENGQTLKLLFSLYKKKNVVFLEGNHEKWLRMWADGLEAGSREFETNTRPQIESEKVSKKDARDFCRKLCQCCYLSYGGREFFITHGGLSTLPENIIVIPTETMIKGVGKYYDADKVDFAFTETTNENVYQIHGHRNVLGSPVQSSDRTFNLEGNVENGGNLRVVQITPDGITTCEQPNTVFKQETEPDASEESDLSSVENLVEKMRKSRYIQEKQYGRISSFNFTRGAFHSGSWDDLITKARGLFIDTKDYKIVARSYNKFFNIGERPETKLDVLREHLKFPLSAYVKENGFLGIVGINPDNNELLITSKSSPDSDFAGYLKEDLISVYGHEVIDKMKEYIIQNDVSFVFECCDKERDPHIISYPKTKIVLLDIIDNKVQFSKLPYNELTEVAKQLGLLCKVKAFELHNWDEFFKWLDCVKADEYKFNGNYIEGFVVEDSNNYMVKVKLDYYLRWKKLRGVAQSALRYGNYSRTGSLTTREENDFFGYCKMLYKNLSAEERADLLERSGSNICSMREQYYRWKETENDLS